MSQMDRQMDRQTKCDRKTELCTVMHHAVKRKQSWYILVKLLLDLKYMATNQHTCHVGELQSRQQESCAIAKMTVQCALHMSALKVFECA